MTRPLSRSAARALAGMLVVTLTVATGGCPGRSQSNATASQAASVASGTIGSLALPTTPPGEPPDNNPPMDPALASMFSEQAKAGGEVGEPVDPHSLTPAELQFGRAPKLGPQVTYQPDVLVMDHGDTALRSMESNGIVWHFDANAPQVDQIAQGKVIFATDRCVGRVGAVTRKGDDVAVVLEPVQITDVIQRGHFVYDKPLDLSSVVVAPIPDVPVQFSRVVAGATPSASPSATTTYETRHLHLTSVSYAMVTPNGKWKRFRLITYDAHGRPRQHFLEPAVDRVAQAGPSLGSPAGGGMPSGIPAPPAGIGAPPVPQVDVNNMAASLCLSSCGGLGVELEYDDHGLKIYAYSTFYLHDPHIDFNIDIDTSGIELAAISLGGMAGFKTEFVAGSNQDQVANIHITKPIPLDTVLPLNFIAPIGIHLNANLKLDSGFSAKTGYLAGAIDFQMGRYIAVGYRRAGGWFADFPTIDVKTPYANLSGVSVGINSLVFGMSERLLVGLGIAGFAAGPYVALTESMSSLKQSSTAMVDCRQATLGMQLDAGVGWSIPALITKVVNIFLTLANAAPLPDHGSLIQMQPRNMLLYKGSMPKNCAG